MRLPGSELRSRFSRDSWAPCREQPGQPEMPKVAWLSCRQP